MCALRTLWNNLRAAKAAREGLRLLRSEQVVVMLFVVFGSVNFAGSITGVLYIAFVQRCGMPVRHSLAESLLLARSVAGWLAAPGIFILFALYQRRKDKDTLHAPE